VKHRLEALYDRLRLHVAARFGGLFGLWYRHAYTPRPGSLAHLLSTFSHLHGPGLTLIQIGANDGLKRDPLHKFIRRDGWRGVLLEPQRRIFERWLAPLHARNDRIETVNAALGPRDGEATLHCVAFSDARWATGLASFQREQVAAVLETEHARREAAREGVAIPTAPEARIRSETVPVLSPETLVERHGLGEPSLLFIDTEGFDYEVVKLFTGAGVHPRMVVYENDHLSHAEAAACQALLASTGYRVGHLGPNSFAVRGASGELEEFFSRTA
jgi:FkbM family methyltransferase